ncbi:MAG: GAF domain-containing protein [Paludibaculum sp.]
MIEFARELSSEMDLDRTLTRVGERLLSTLSVAHVAFFLSKENEPGFQLHPLWTGMAAAGGEVRAAGPQLPDGFSGRPVSLLREHSARAGHRDARQGPSVRATIAELDLTYYLPCNFRGKTLAWLGVSRSNKGDFLSSDDIDLLASLAGYIAMAVENARLYRSLAAKAEQYERLKEFSENIVESINVGILAADLEDRVESWNSQIERLTGIPRDRRGGTEAQRSVPRRAGRSF